MSTQGRSGRVLLTGASGYVGGRLLNRLQQQDVPLRCMSRSPEKLKDKVAPQTERVQGDVLDADSLKAAFRDVDTVYYLVHSMGADNFEEKDRQAAHNVVEAARECQVRHIIYLSGLGDEDDDLSPHLRSRQEVGRILRTQNVPCTEFRAAVVLGAGSISFKMIQALSHRLPIMICPRWTQTSTQPIASADIVEYLLQARQSPPDRQVVYEVGGADVVDYLDMIREYCAQARLKRFLVPVPVLTTKLSGYWLQLVTPANAAVGRELITGLKNPTVVQNDSARQAFPEIRPKSMHDAMQEALAG